MKNKRLTYFIIPLVLLVWGLIFYRIFIGMGDDDDGPALTVAGHKSKPEEARDTFLIAANYRDPFLSGYQKPIARGTEGDDVYGNPMGFQVKSEVKPPIAVPELKYSGLIINTKNKKKVGLFRMGNKDLILKEGDVQDDFKIITLFNDSAKVMYKTVKKTFKKNTNQS